MLDGGQQYLQYLWTVTWNPPILIFKLGSVRMKLNWQNIQEVEIVQQRSAELRNVQILFKTTCLNADYTHTLNSILLHF